MTNQIKKIGSVKTPGSILEARLQQLYDSEINFSISCFWDGGFEVRLGDEMNGWKETMTVRHFDSAVDVLWQLAAKYYPKAKVFQV